MSLGELWVFRSELGDELNSGGSKVHFYTFGFYSCDVINRPLPLCADLMTSQSRAPSFCADLMTSQSRAPSFCAKRWRHGLALWRHTTWNSMFHSFCTHSRILVYVVRLGLFKCCVIYVVINFLPDHFPESSNISLDSIFHEDSESLFGFTVALGWLHVILCEVHTVDT
jgi:hypothetical protein